MAAGPGAFHPQTGSRVPLGLKVGDSVLLPQYGGNAVKLNGEELLLYKESEILAVLEK
jgi:co-chaperonin GroES (HSP10)